MAQVDPAHLKTCGPMDPFNGAMDIFYGIFFRKIIQII
jgi:hypothetical protein